MKQRKIILIFLFAILCSKFAVANSKAIIVDEENSKEIYPISSCVSFFEDKENAYTISDIIELQNDVLFKSNVGKNASFGYARSTIWAKFEINNLANIEHNLIFVIPCPTINELSFYAVKNDRIVKEIHTGDARVFSSRDIDHRNFVFDLNLESKSSYSYYIKARNHGEVLRLPMALYNHSRYILNSNIEDVLTGAFFGLLIFVLAFTIFLYYSMKDRLYLFYMLYVLFVYFYLNNIEGISFEYFWPNNPWFANHSTIVFAAIGNIFLLYFAKAFLSIKKCSYTLNSIYNGLMIIAIVVSAMAMFNGLIYRYSILGVNLFLICSILTILVSSFFSTCIDKKQVYYISLAFLFFVISVVVYMMKNLGVIEDNYFTSFSLKTGFACKLLLLTFAITDRFRKLKDTVNQDLEDIVEIKTEEIKSQNEEVIQQSEYLEKVNEELKLLSTIVSETDYGVTIFSVNGEIEWQNKGFGKLFGYNYSDKLLLKTSNVFELSENENFLSFFRKAEKTKKTVSYKTNLINRFGKSIWVQTSLTPILNNENEITKYIVIDTDITALKSSEEELKLQNLNITSSIRTAQEIQKAFMPPNHVIKKLLPESFIFLRPKDIVSGDFYWIGRKDHYIFFAAVDCTGHGVPGAFMSIMGINLLNQAIKEKKLTRPSDILSFMNRAVNRTLRQGKHSDTTNEGMDMVVCAMNYEQNSFQFAGAKNSIYILREGALIEIKGDKHSVGIIHEDAVKKFINHEIDIKRNDIVYLFTDGFADQFGGENRKKYMKKNFKKLFLRINELPMAEQKEEIVNEFDNWKGNYDQIDDVLVMGVKF